MKKQFFCAICTILLSLNVTADCQRLSMEELKYHTKEELIKMYCSSNKLALISLKLVENMQQISQASGVDSSDQVEKDMNEADCYSDNAGKSWLILRKDYEMSDRPVCE